MTDDAYRQLMKHAHRLAMDGHGADHADHHATTDDHCACDQHAAADGADHQHNACDVCTVTALGMVVADLHNPPTAHSQLVRPAERFASIEARQGVKPPIS